MTNNKPLRILVVDDTVLYRKIVTDILTELPDVAVVGTAPNGEIALSKIASLKPDLLTLDIDMPKMDGLEVLDRMRSEAPDVGAIMLSAYTPKDGEMTIKALELGAFDFILKPQDRGLLENMKILRTAIAPMVKAFGRLREVRKILRKKRPLPVRGKTGAKTQKHPGGLVQPMGTIADRTRQRSKIVAIGISTGGPVALASTLMEIPADLKAPILIVQHMPPMFTRALAKQLNNKCSIEVKEAEDGERLRPHTAFIAPGGKQMKLANDPFGKNRIIRITDDPPENGCAPSADYLFRSVARHFGGEATGVIMTGMGSDGGEGLKLMKQKGATIIAQDELTSIVFGMARKPIETGIVDVVAPLDRMAKEIMRTLFYP